MIVILVNNVAEANLNYLTCSDYVPKSCWTYACTQLLDRCMFCTLNMKLQFKGISSALLIMRGVDRHFKESISSLNRKSIPLLMVYFHKNLSAFLIKLCPITFFCWNNFVFESLGMNFLWIINSFLH